MSPWCLPVVCDLVFDGDWRGTLNARQFEPGCA